MSNRRTLQTLLGLALVALPTLAFAGTTVQPGDILQVYKNLETQWASNAAQIGTDLFGVFAGLEFAWTWISWLLEKGGGDGESVIPTLLKKILQLTFGFWLVENAASGLNLIGTLIDGFEWLGTHVGGASVASITSTGNSGYLTPGGIFNEGITIAAALWKSAYSGITITNIGHDLGVVFITVPAVLLVAATFAFLSLSLIMTLVETYL
ncbi:type IV secretion system protein, partial [Acidithiobacillus sp.]|uniref:type IV secretion system protein n=1 Tax=Acidithiobacillus sp. TaxID=1872118 RepID=UPI003D069E1D